MNAASQETVVYNCSICNLRLNNKTDLIISDNYDKNVKNWQNILDFMFGYVSEML